MTLFQAGQLFLCMAVSLDSLGVGIFYGIRRIRIPVFGFLLILASSVAVAAVSMTIGETLSMYISSSIVDFIGGCILVFLGLFSLYPKPSEKKAPKASKSSSWKGKTAKHRNVKKLAFPLSVIRHAQKADLDQSGSISAKEALLLGTALSLDAFGAGLGAAIVGYPPMSTALLIGVFSSFFLFAGMKMGALFGEKKGSGKLALLPPFLLIFIGVCYML